MADHVPWVPPRVEYGTRRPDGRIQDKRDPAPHDLVLVNDCRVHVVAATALAHLRQAAREAGHRPPLLSVISGYRPAADQAARFRAAVKRYGSEAEARRWVAPPGHSAHQSGRALDLEIGTPVDSAHAAEGRRTAIYLWLQQHAAEYGFFGYQPEPWHWEYNP